MEEKGACVGPACDQAVAGVGVSVVLLRVVDGWETPVCSAFTSVG